MPKVKGKEKILKAAREKQLIIYNEAPILLSADFSTETLQDRRDWLTLWKTVWRFLKKLRIDLSYDPAIPLLGIYPKDLKTHIRKDICTPMFIAALFTVART